VPLPRAVVGGRLVLNEVRDSLPGGAVMRSDDRSAKLARSDAGGMVNVGRSIVGAGGAAKLERSVEAEGGGGGQLCRSLGAGGGQL